MCIRDSPRGGHLPKLPHIICIRPRRSCSSGRPAWHIACVCGLLPALLRRALRRGRRPLHTRPRSLRRQQGRPAAGAKTLATRKMCATVSAEHMTPPSAAQMRKKQAASVFFHYNITYITGQTSAPHCALCSFFAAEAETGVLTSGRALARLGAPGFAWGTKVIKFRFPGSNRAKPPVFSLCALQGFLIQYK